MAKAKCPHCGSGKVLLEQHEIHRYPITNVERGGEGGPHYDMGQSMDFWFECTEERFWCEDCERYMHINALEDASCEAEVTI